MPALSGQLITIYALPYKYKRLLYLFLVLELGLDAAAPFAAPCHVDLLSGRTHMDIPSIVRSAASIISAWRFLPKLRRGETSSRLLVGRTPYPG